MATGGGDRGRFDLAGPEVSPYLSQPMVGRGAAAGDLDNDGRADGIGGRGDLMKPRSCPNARRGVPP